MKAAVVTGGTSFIGVALIHELLSRGYQCYTIVRPNSPGKVLLPVSHEQLHVIDADLHDITCWEPQIPSCQLFFHLAWGGVGAEGRANPEIQEDNIQLSLQCMEAAKRLGAKRFLFAGSQAEYGINDDYITEKTPCVPVTEYGKAKRRFLSLGTEKAAQLQMEYVHLRIFSVYGPHDHPWTLVCQCLQKFSNNERMALSSCTQKWNYVYVDDAAKAMGMMGECPLLDQNPVYHIAGEDTRELKAFVDTIWRMAGKRGSIGYGERGNTQEKPHGIDPSVERLIKATGWKQTISFEEGIEKMLQQGGAGR